MKLLLLFAAIAAFGLLGVLVTAALVGFVVAQFWGPILLIILCAIFKDQIRDAVQWATRPRG